ncbi:TetR/AcrR family transcriptional regulator [Corynebacterium godavarianum]|uniref:TetR/AcrR family transcriptional regulator n=2 Tax=Corynebacterium godavarianum TaxID=2054421 RepID=A0ABY3E497_9CORY|nr:TetR/AcrR family transcriptional regulator [Corynebacterium godavarianum]
MIYCDSIDMSQCIGKRHAAMSPSYVVSEKGPEMVNDKPEQERAKAKRASIEKATIDLLLQEGMSSVTHRHVAARAGVPVGSIGYYYESREKLIQTCFERFHAVQAAILEEALKNPKIREDRRELAAATLDLVTCGHRDWVRGIISATVDAEREAPALQAMVKEQFYEAVNAIDALLKYADVTKADGNAVLGAIVGSSLVVAGWDKPVVETTISGVVRFLELAEGP